MNVTITPNLEGAGNAIYVDGKFFSTVSAGSLVMKYTVYVRDNITFTTFDEQKARDFAAGYKGAEIFAQLTIVTPLIEI